VMDKQTVWVETARCTGCGACVEVCPAGAIALMDGKACIDEEACTGCGACVDACPEGAIQPVIQGELIPAPERVASTVHQPSPLVETAGAAVVAAGAGLLMKAAGASVRAVGRWLMRRPAGTGPSLRRNFDDLGRRRAQTSASSAESRAGGGAGRRHRARHGRRGQ
jgi:NAD-dependent dihydropyrimidine dehydrogenase PreA subunit